MGHRYNDRERVEYDPRAPMPITPYAEPHNPAPPRRPRRPPTPPTGDAALTDIMAGLGIGYAGPQMGREASIKSNESTDIEETKRWARQDPTRYALSLVIFYRETPKAKKPYKGGEWNRHWGIFVPLYNRSKGILIDVNPNDARRFTTSVPVVGYRYHTLSVSMKESGSFLIGGALASFSWVEDTFEAITANQDWNIWFNNCQQMVTRFIQHLANDPTIDFNQRDYSRFFETHGTRFTTDKALAKSDKFQKGPSSSTNSLGRLANIVSFSCQYCQGTPCVCGTTTAGDTQYYGSMASKTSGKSTKKPKSDYGSSSRSRDRDVEEIPLERRNVRAPEAQGGYQADPLYTPGYPGAARGPYDHRPSEANYGYPAHDYPAPLPPSQPQRPRHNRDYRENRDPQGGRYNEYPYGREGHFR